MIQLRDAIFEQKVLKNKIYDDFNIWNITELKEHCGSIEDMCGELEQMINDVKANMATPRPLNSKR